MDIPLKSIIDILSPLTVYGAAESVIRELVRLDALPQNNSQLFWCNDSNISKLETLQGGTVICSPLAAQGTRNPKLVYLVVNNPRLGFLKVAQTYFNEKPATGIKPTAIIDDTVKLGTKVSISHHVVIEEGCTIGNNTSIGPNTVIHRNTVIGNHVTIGANNTIGGVGFGYEKDEAGTYQFIPHLGNVIIEDNVDIGNNTCIDRAPMGSTRICKNVKIDNLVHVAHGCIIHENALLIAHAMIGGSTEIGSSAWIAPGATVRNGITVGADALVGLGAVVVNSVEPGAVVLGNPARARTK